MPIFSSYGVTLSSQIWIIERFLLAVSLPFAFLFIEKSFNKTLVFAFYILLTVVLLCTVYIWKIFPITFIEGVGLTQFKKNAEYTISLLFLFSTFLIYRYRHTFDKTTYRFLTAAFVLNVVAEILFTFYVNLHAFIMVIAHTLILFSYYFVYKAIIEVGLTKPYNLLFFEMQRLSDKKDELLSITSHELKNPLTSIKLYSHLLGKVISKSKKLQKSTYAISQIESQVEKINRIISNLSDVSKIETNQLKLQITSIAPKQFITEIVNDFREKYPKHKIVMKVGKLPNIYGDKELIDQVIDNLITNAIKYSPRHDLIRIQAEKKQNYICFSVQDKGVGIAKNKIGQIFDKYFRGDNVVSAQGIGLGLYIAKQIVEAHKGKIWVQSQSNKGSTFFFQLPLETKPIKK